MEDSNHVQQSTTSTSLQPQVLPPFLRIPIELRMLIFKHVFSDVHPSIRHYNLLLKGRVFVLCDPESTTNLRYSPHPLLFTNKEIASQTADLFHQEVTVPFQNHLPSALRSKIYNTRIPLNWILYLELDFPRLRQLHAEHATLSTTRAIPYASPMSTVSHGLPNLRSLVVKCWISVANTPEWCVISQNSAIVQRLIFLRRSFELKIKIFGRRRWLRSSVQNDFETHWTAKSGLVHIRVPDNFADLEVKWDDLLRKLLEPEDIDQVFEGVEEQGVSSIGGDAAEAGVRETKIRKLQAEDYEAARAVVADHKLEAFDKLWQKRFST